MTQAAADPAPATGPYDSIRDYVRALEAHGRLLRLPPMDQDRFEATAFAYRLIEKYGYDTAPAFSIPKVRIGGEWLEGPVLGNVFGGWTAEALAFGVPEVGGEERDMYRATFRHLEAMVDEQRRWPVIPPVEVPADGAPCREVVLRGDDIDLTRLPILQTNPGDAGRYITAGSVFMEDPELGRNVGTYRCQLKGPRKIAVNAETGQHAWNFITKVRQRGQPTVPAAVVIGADPVTFALGTSKLSALGEDELHLAGGLRGRPVALVRAESIPLLVPAHAEIVIEGEIPTGEMEPEGPYGEVYGYMGLPKPKNFFMNVTAVTHRHAPWMVNAFAGITKLTPGMPQSVSNHLRYRELVPNLVEFLRPQETTGVAVLSIDKKLPGEGIASGQHIAAADIFAKVIIVVDKDIDVHDKTQVYHAMGTRWQPHPATLMVPQTRGFPLDPSQPVRWLTSKIIIDATRQWPQEGGPDKWPEISRVILDEREPGAFDLVRERWDEYFRDWPR